MDAQHATRGEQLHELAPRGIKTGDAGEPDDLLIIVMGKNVDELPRGGVKACLPTSRRPCGHRRAARPARLARDRAWHRRTATPEVVGDKGGEHARWGA